MKGSDIGFYALSGGLAMVLLSGCGGTQLPIGAPGAMPQSRGIAQKADRIGSWMSPQARHKKIKHVVIIVQMDRSFNNLFNGYPGAKTVSYGYDSEGQKIELKPISLAARWGLALTQTPTPHATASENFPARTAR